MIVGGGATGAANEVRVLAERLGAAVIPTIAGKGVLPADHSLSLEMTLDQEGTQEFIRNAGLVVAIGTELAEPDVWVSDTLPMNGKFLRIDIDAETLARDYRPDIAVLGDAGESLAGIIQRLEGRNLQAGFSESAIARRARLVARISVSWSACTSR